MALIDFSTPAAGFDQPLQLWQACHERIHRMTHLLERLALHIAEHGGDAAARTTASQIRRYFEEAAPRHHEDEEQDLFPRLQRRLARKKTAAAASLQNEIEALCADHRELAALWAPLRECLLQCESGAAATLELQAVRTFGRRYRDHADREDARIGAAMLRLFDADELQDIGRAMAQRRGVNWEDISAAIAGKR